MSVRFVDEFRDAGLAKTLADVIRSQAKPGRSYNLMEFCGGHTHAVFRYGVPDLLPENVRMIHGPGCPVCVLPIPRVAEALQLALDHEVILCTYGDMLRVPGPQRQTLLQAKAAGADVRIIYSCLDVLTIARAHPDRQVVFFAIGFETTTPPTAVALRQAKALALSNFSVHCNHVLTPPAILALLDSPEARDGNTLRLDGFIGPAHVSAVIGSRPFEPFTERYQKPVVIAGFEPLDVMQAILMLIQQLNDGRAAVENEYTRVVTREGNVKAKRLMSKIFELRESFEWRGLGPLPWSALRIREEYADYDAERRFPLSAVRESDSKACECPSVLRGSKQPTDCRIFATACTPDNPIGACMVSSEGACAAYYRYGRARERRRAIA